MSLSAKEAIHGDMEQPQREHESEEMQGPKETLRGLATQPLIYDNLFDLAREESLAGLRGSSSRS